MYLYILKPQSKQLLKQSFFGNLEKLFPTNTGQEGRSSSARIFPPQFGKQSQRLYDIEDTILFHRINAILNNEYKWKCDLSCNSCEGCSVTLPRPPLCLSLATHCAPNLSHLLSPEVIHVALWLTALPADDFWQLDFLDLSQFVTKNVSGAFMLLISLLRKRGWMRK